MSWGTCTFTLTKECPHVSIELTLGTQIHNTQLNIYTEPACLTVSFAHCVHIIPRVLLLVWLWEAKYKEVVYVTNYNKPSTEEVCACQGCSFATATKRSQVGSEARSCRPLLASVHTLQTDLDWCLIQSLCLGSQRFFSQKTRKKNNMLFAIFHDPCVLCRNMFLSFYQCIHLPLLSWLRQDIKPCKTRV